MAHETVSDVDLSKEELERHARHVSLRGFGPVGQEKLSNSSVLVVGAGGLGCPCAMYLAGAGIGKLAVIDADAVATSNLHRQIGHNEHRVGESKTESLKSTCAALNSNVQIQTHCERLTAANAAALVATHDVVADCSDNPATRYLVNDACVATGTPLVSGAAVATDGQLSVYGYRGGPCYRCIYPECPTPGNCSSCEEAGVLGPVPGVIGTLQALECIKILSGVGAPLSQSLLLYDALSARFTTVKLRGRREGCVGCSSSAELMRPGAIAAYDYAAFTGAKPPSPPAGGANDSNKSGGAINGADARSEGMDTAKNGGVYGATPKTSKTDGGEISAGATTHNTDGGKRGIDGGIATTAAQVSGASPPIVPGNQPGPLRVAPADLQRMLTDSKGSVPDLATRDLPPQEGGHVNEKENGDGGGAPVHPVQGGMEPRVGGGVLLVDVRPAELYAATRMHGAMHVGMREVEKRAAEIKQAQKKQGHHTPVVVMCRRGNDSQLAAATLRSSGVKHVYDLVGGLHAWADAVDPKMPKL